MSQHYKEIACHTDRQAGSLSCIKRKVKAVRAFTTHRSMTDQSNVRFVALVLLGLLAATVALLLFLGS